VSDSTIKLGLKSIINEQTGMTVIYAEHDGPKPSRKPYVVLRLDGEIRLGMYDEEGSPDVNGLITMKGQRQRIVGLQMIGTGSLNSIGDLQSAFNKRSVLDALIITHKLTIISVGNVQNITGLLETDFEERASLELTIGYAVETADDVGLIEHVEINDELIDLP